MTDPDTSPEALRRLAGECCRASSSMDLLRLVGRAERVLLAAATRIETEYQRGLIDGARHAEDLDCE